MNPQITSTPPSETNAIRRAAVREPGAAAAKNSFNGRSNFLKQKLLRINTKNGSADASNKEKGAMNPVSVTASSRRTVDAAKKPNGEGQRKSTLPSFKVTWDSDETMAAYLGE
jgi:hypothetical protein